MVTEGAPIPVEVAREWGAIDEVVDATEPTPAGLPAAAIHSKAAGIPRRVIGDDEILDRCLLSMINEGAKILEEGVAAREADIDMV